MRSLTALVFLFLLAAACGKPLGGPIPGSDYKVYEATSSQQLAVIDSRSHLVERSLPLGALSDSSHLYATSSRALLDIDPQTGATQGMLNLPGYYQLPPLTISGIPGGLSQNGMWLVVESFEGNGSIPRATHMLVIETAPLKVAHRLDMQGDFQYDAISNDGMRLYLIQYLSSSEYKVRLYDLVGNALDANIVVDKADGNQAMTGQRLMGVASPDGNWLYSMYVREQGGPFIHALSMQGPFAFCIDLPGNGYANDVHWSLAMSRDGSRLFAANGVLGLVAQVEPATNYQPAVKRIVHYDSGQPARFAFVQNAEAKEAGAGGAAVTPDGRTLVVSGDKGLAWIDTDSLRSHDHALTDWRIWSLAVSGDGMALYAVNDAGMMAELSMGPGHSFTTFGGAPGQPLALVRIDGGSP